MANITKSASKTLTAPVSSSAKFTLTARLEEINYNIANNTSTVKVIASLSSGSWNFTGGSQHTLKVFWYDNNSYTSGTSSSKTITSLDRNSTITVEKILYNVPHNNATGVLKGYAKATWTRGNNQYAPSSGNVSTAETMLTTIPRNPSFTTSPTIVSTSEEGFIIDRGVTNIDSTFVYSIKVTGTSDPLPITPSILNSSVIYGYLNSDTSYTVTITAKNSANPSLTTDVNVVVKTWAYPSISGLSVLNLSPGNTQTILLNNPHNRNVTWYMLKNTAAISGGSEVTHGTSSSSSININTANYIDSLFSNTDGLGTDKTSIDVCYYISYEGRTSSIAGTISTTEAAYKPFWNNIDPKNIITYEDIDATTISITGNNQLLVTGKSKIQYARDINYSATANRSTINHYEMSLDGENYQTITGGDPIPAGGVLINDSATSIKIYLRAVDERNYKSEALIRTITGNNLKPYALPTAAISATRKNGFSDTVELRINPTWSVNSINNKGTAVWAWKQGTGTSGYSSDTSINVFNQKRELPGDYDNSKTYTFRVKITDAFGGSSDYLYTTVGPGKTIMFIDATTQGVGINCFPNSKYKLDIDGSTHISAGTTIDGAIQKNRYAIAGQTSNTAGDNNWFKFASINISSGYADKNIWFKVYSGYGDNSTAIGELIAHIRTKSDRSFNNGELKWINCGTGINLNDFVMAYFNDNTGENIVLKVELWAKVPNSWRRYKFIVQAEGEIQNETAGDWTLYKAVSASGEEAPTEGYTLINSSLVTLKNSISGNAATATEANFTSKLASPSSSRIASADLDHSYINGKATERIDAVTSSMTTSKPAADGWIETFFWDGASAYDAQLYIPNTNKRLQWRYRGNQAWVNNWKDIAFYDDIPQDSGWQNITLNTREGVSAGSLGTPQYKKVGNQVFLRGSYNGNIGSSALDLGTVPSECYPPNDVRFMISESDKGYIGRAGITTNGEIRLDWMCKAYDSSNYYTGSFEDIDIIVSYWVD